MATNSNKATLILDANTKDFLVKLGDAQKAAEQMKKSAKEAERASSGIAKGFRNAANAAALLEGPLGGVAGRLSALATTVGKLNPVMVVLGVTTAGIAVSLRAGLATIGQTQTAYSRLAAQIQVTNNVAGLSAAAIDDFSRELARATLASTDEIRRASGVLLSFQTVAGDTFTEVIELALDMATVLGTDVVSATQQIGKSLQDPLQGLSQLNELGVRFTQTQKDLVLSLLLAGDGIGAQKILLDQIRERYSGVAKATSGLQTAYDSLAQSVTEFNEAFVKSIGLDALVSSAVNKLADTINNARRALFGDETITDYENSIKSLIIEESKYSRLLDRRANTPAQTEYFTKKLEEVQAKLKLAREAVAGLKSVAGAAGEGDEVPPPKIIKPALSDKEFRDAELRAKKAVEAIQQEIETLRGYYVEAEMMAYESQRQEAKRRAQEVIDTIGARENRAAEILDIETKLNEELEKLQEAHQLRLQQARDRESKEIDEKRQQKLDKELEQYRYREENRQAALDAAAAGQQFLSSLAKEGSREAVALLAVEKSIAIARAVLSLHTAIATANANPNILTRAAAIAQAFAVGTAAVAAVKSVQLAGARARGGPVEEGRSYMVGERGPEVVTFGSSGMVTPNDKLAPKINVNIIEDSSRAGQVNQSGNNIDVFVAAAMSRIAGDISRGRGMATVFESQYGLRRRGS